MCIRDSPETIRRFSDYLADARTTSKNYPIGVKGSHA